MRTLPGVGELTQDDDLPEWWASNPIPIPYFDGRPITIIVTTDSEGDAYPFDVADAVHNFLSLTSLDREAATERVHKNFQDFVEAIGPDNDLDMAIDRPTDIWHYVEPTKIYVSRRHRLDRDVYVQIACECEWEDEHGLQIIYRRGNRLVRVSDEDGHLTEADAYGLAADPEA